MNPTFFCDLGALTAPQRQRHSVLAKKLRPLAVAFEELPDGYAVRLRSAPAEDLKEFMVLEKRCCPFFTLTLESGNLREDEDRITVLRITGPGDIRPFIRREFGIPENRDLI